MRERAETIEAADLSSSQITEGPGNHVKGFKLKKTPEEERHPKYFTT